MCHIFILISVPLSFRMKIRTLFGKDSTYSTYKIRKGTVTGCNSLFVLYNWIYKKLWENFRPKRYISVLRAMMSQNSKKEECSKVYCCIQTGVTDIVCLFFSFLGYSVKNVPFDYCFTCR